MAHAAEALDPSEVYRILDRRRHIAVMTRADPEGHRRMLRRAGRILAGHDQGTVTAADQRATITERLAAATNASDGPQN